MIDVQDLDFFLGGSPLLEKVSFNLYEGECVAFFGPNGGGKTTLLSLLMGFYKPTRGKIILQSKKIGYVPQNFALDPHFPISVEEVISLVSPEHVEESLAAVSMQNFAKASFPELSGGERQRVLLARAISCKPDILLLDESTANVDHETKKKIYELLQSLKGKVTIIIVTHDLNEAALLADRLFCVQKRVSEIPKKQLCNHFFQGLYHGDPP